MSNKDFFSNLRSIAKTVDALVGETCEVSVCDVETGIIDIPNPHLTGRTSGCQIDPQILRFFLSNVDTYKEPVLYPSQSQLNGKPLVCSSVILFDEGTPKALFTINVDATKQINLADVYNHDSLYEIADHATGNTDDTLSVKEYAKKLIHNILLSSNALVGKPLNLSSKESKLSILEELDQRGVLDVRDMVPYVCEVLSISQASLYNYLKEIRNKS